MKATLFYSIEGNMRLPSPNVNEGIYEGYYGTSGEGEGKYCKFVSQI
jgi:hypothetical protein